MVCSRLSAISRLQVPVRRPGYGSRSSAPSSTLHSPTRNRKRRKAWSPPGFDDAPLGRRGMTRGRRRNEEGRKLRRAAEEQIRVFRSRRPRPNRTVRARRERDHDGGVVIGGCAKKRGGRIVVLAYRCMEAKEQSRNQGSSSGGRGLSGSSSTPDGLHLLATLPVAT